MTRDEIMAMQPGPELDAEIARIVFGHKLRQHPIYKSGMQYALPGNDGDWWWAVPYYSTTWEGMRLVVEALKRMGKVVIIKVDGLGVEDGKLYRDLLPPYVVYVGDCEGIRYKEAPHAVAIAALLALEGEVRQGGV